MVVALALATTSVAADIPIAASTLKIKRSASGKEKLIFVTKDPAVPFPLTAPSPFQFFIKVISTGVPEAVQMPLREFVEPYDGPPEFTSKGSTPHRSYRFEYKNAPSSVTPVKSLTWREGRGIKIVARRGWLSLAGQSGSVALRLAWGSSTASTRVCTVFEGDAVKIDKAGSYRGSKAPVPSVADCSDGQLAGDLPASCGDGVIEAGEECDGSFTCDLTGQPESIIYGDYAQCVVPSAPDECTCCSNLYDPYGSLPCCQPSVILAIGPPAGTGLCIPISCEPPFECASSDTCLPDQTCCGGEGSLCGDLISGIARDCCDGLTCTYDSGLYFCRQP